MDTIFAPAEIGNDGRDLHDDGRGARMPRLPIYIGQIAVDAAGMGLGFLIAQAALQPFALRAPDALLTALSVIVFGLVSGYAHAYSPPAILSLHTAVPRVFHAWFVTLAMVLLISFAGKNSASFSRSVFFVGASLGLALVIVGRCLIVWVLGRRLRAALMKQLLVVDDAPLDAQCGFDRAVASALGIGPDTHDPHSLHRFSHLVRGYDRVVVSCQPERRESWALYLQAVGCNGELWMPELARVPLLRNAMQSHLPIVQVAVGPMALSDRIAKRLLDLAVTVPLIIALTPLLVLVATAVRLDSAGPVLFRQQRMGRGNQLFDVFKFRSMQHEQADPDGSRSASRDDGRITRVGRLIRMTSLDELPQLFNVLQGDMALVGPRPHALGSRAGNELFWHVDRRYCLRHAIKPGMTGLAQVRGFRGATDEHDDLANRLHSDLEYIVGWSIFRDFAILAQTIKVLVHVKAY